MRWLILLLLFCGSLTSTCISAFPLPEWPYERLSKESDIIVIATFDKTNASPDSTRIAIVVDDEYQENLAPVISTFRVKQCLKGKLDDSFNLEHFRYRAGQQFKMGNGPQIVDFRSGIQQLSCSGWAAALEPEYILFLKKLGNGNFRLAGPSEYMPLSVRIVFPQF